MIRIQPYIISMDARLFILILMIAILPIMLDAAKDVDYNSCRRLAEQNVIIRESGDVDPTFMRPTAPPDQYSKDALKCYEVTK